VLAPGVPLRVMLERHVSIKKVGEPIQGRLVEPIYIYDHVVLPAGSTVEGLIAKIGGVPAGRRIAAILSGNFTPPREVRAAFDAIQLKDGSRLPVHTVASLGTAHTMRVVKSTAKAGLDGMDPAAALAYKQPGKLSRLKSRMFSMLPYHRQGWSAGTLFSAALEEPLTLPQMASPASAAPAAPEAQEVYARLLTPLSSATARKGSPVEAVVTRPVFSAAHTLLIPEGTRLTGEVVEAQHARMLHRNGKLLFVFHQIQPPAGAAQTTQGYIEGMDADFNAHLALDSEGAARVSSSKTRFIFPAMAAAVAGLSLHQDVNAQGVPDQDIGGRAESGAVGLGLIGTVLAQASRPLASTIAFSGAAFSIYTTFIARGSNVVLPLNTPVQVSLRSH
jgi:hypothetical protein